MKLKSIVGLSLVVFSSVTALILFVGLVLIKPAAVALETDPVSGLPVVSDESGVAKSGTTTLGPGATPTPAEATPTPTVVAVAATPKPGAAATPTPKPGAGTPVATPKPGGTPAPTVAPTPAPVVYCQGKSPCYGPSVLAGHTANNNCWGYNRTWVINLTGYAPSHPNGSANVIASNTCGKNIAGALDGSVSVSGTHAHKSATITNAVNSLLAQYRVGYYDASKP